MLASSKASARVSTGSVPLAPSPRSMQGQRTRRLAVTRSFQRDWFDQGQPKEVAEEVVNFFLADGTVVRLPGRVLRVPREPRTPRVQQPLPSWEEQTLCIGASFLLAATNGHDPQRRISFTGFCQSVDLLLDAVEDTVLTRGGEILEESRELKSGLHERLSLTVAIPLLWGVPPTLECLKSAITVGGGVVDRVHYRWTIY